MIYTFVKGQKKVIDTLYTFVNGQKKYIHTVDTFIDGNRKNLFISSLHPSFYVLVGSDNTSTDKIYVISKKNHNLREIITLPKNLYGIETIGYYNTLSKKLLLFGPDSFNTNFVNVIVIDCRRNIVSSSTSSSIDPHTYAYNNESGLFCIMDKNLTTLHMFNLMTDEQYELDISQLNLSNIFSCNIIVRSNIPYLIIGGYNNVGEKSTFFYINISNPQSINPVQYTSQPNETGDISGATSYSINPYLVNIKTPIIYTRGEMIGYSTYLNLVKYNSFTRINTGSQNRYRFLGYCSSLGYIYKCRDTNNFYYCNPNTNSIRTLNIDLTEAHQSEFSMDYPLKWSNSLCLGVDENSTQLNYILCSNYNPDTEEDKSIGLICSGGVFKKFTVSNIYNSIGAVSCSDEQNIYFLTSGESYVGGMCDSFITGVHLESTSSTPVVTQYNLPAELYESIQANQENIYGLFVSY